ncbi:MAG: zinc-ribbon domain-containing protein [Limosilactobacillus sp.]|nr:zinc-ribbon domain-containing protein [Limosilactobacillus sp.]
MKFCPNCGTQTEPGATNCFNCGFALPQPKAPSPTKQPHNPTPTKFDDYPVGVQDDHNSLTEQSESSSPLTGLITTIIIVTIIIALIIFIF